MACKRIEQPLYDPKMRFQAIVCFILITVLFSCNGITSSKSLKLAHGLDVTHPVHQAMVFMADKVSENSDGKLTLEIYPSQQLGTERQCLELLQIGSLAMTKVSAATMENFAPKLQVLGLPYLFRDRKHVYDFQDSKLGKDLLVESEQFRLRGLTYFDAGFRSFYVKEDEVNNPDDLSGKKIRVMESPTAMALVNDLGGSPTPISYGEVYTALQQGIIDGAENNPPSFYTSRHYEVCKYYSLNEHNAVPDMLIIGTDVWSRLSEEEQGWLQAAVDEAAIEQRKLWQASEKFCLEEVEKAGVIILRPDKKPFMEQTKGILEAYKQNDPELYKIINQIQDIE